MAVIYRKAKRKAARCASRGDNFALCVADVTWSNRDVSLARTTSTHTTGRDETEEKARMTYVSLFETPRQLRPPMHSAPTPASSR